MSATANADVSFAHFDPVFECSSDCMLLVDAESGQIASANPALERQLGVPRGAFNQRSFFQEAALNQVAGDLSAFRTFAAEISDRPRELSLRHSRGENIHFHVRGLGYPAQGKRYLLLSFRPLVMDTRSSATLMKSTWLARMVFENAPDGINVRQVGADFKSMKLLGCNQRYVEMSGFSEAELMAMNDITACQRSLLSPRENAEVEKKIRAMQPVSGVASWLRPDGVENCFEWRGMPMRVGEAIYILGIDRDVTVQRRVLDNLCARQAELDALINNIPDMVWFKDAQSRYITVNAAFQKLTGRPLDELRGKTDFDISPSEISKKYQADDIKVVRTKKALTVEEKHELKGHPTRWIVTTKSPILDQFGKVLGTVGIARDITERRAAEQENAEQRRHLEMILKRIPLKILQQYKIESSSMLRKVEARPHKSVKKVKSKKASKAGKSRKR